MNIKNLSTLELISKNFNTNIDFLQYIANKGYLSLQEIDIKLENYARKKSNIFINMSSFIEIKEIPKRNKKNKSKIREVLEVKSPYNIFYKELLYEIEAIVQSDEKKFISEFAHGFIKGRNTLSNAKKHINKKYILKLDILNFFNSVKIDSVNNVFIKLGCNEDTANLFSKLCTFNEKLKEGLNTSPMIANIFCYDLDYDLAELSKKYNLTYTRYGDDITFSSDTFTFPSIYEINSILKKYELELNNEKTVAVKHGQSQYVTGLSISNDLYPRVPRRLKRKIRQDLYQLDKYFFDTKTDLEYKLRSIYGKIVYTLGIEKELGKKYKEQFLEILNKNDYTLSDIFNDAPTNISNQVFHYMDESEVKINNKHYIALSVVSIFSEELKNRNRVLVENLKNDLQSDLRNGLNDTQRNKLFHYCDDNTYVKGKYQEVLRTLDFESFIIFIEGDSINMKKREYQQKYYQIFSTIFYTVLRRFKNYNNYIYPEENSKIKKQKLEESLNSKKGIPKFNIEISTKNEILLSIPDYVLGIFRDCIKKDLSNNIKKLKPGQTLNEENKINEILDKIRLIIDVSNSKYYSRKKFNKLNCINLNQQISVSITNIEKDNIVKTNKLSIINRQYRKIKRFYSRGKLLIQNLFK